MKGKENDLHTLCIDAVNTEHFNAEVPLSGLQQIDATQLKGNTFINLAMPSAIDLVNAIDRGDFSDLLPYRDAIRRMQGVEGAGALAMPALGAAIAIFNYSSLREAIRSRIRSMQHNATDTSPLLTVLVRFEVGGTGSGVTPFVARALRQVADEEGIPLTLWLISVSSPLFCGASEIRARTNAYAARKELQVLADLFDAIFILGDVIGETATALEPLQILGAIALFIYALVATDLGPKLHQRLPDELANFKKPSVLSFGIARLYTPVVEGIEWSACLLGAAIAERLMGCETNGESEAQAFCNALKLDDQPLRLLQALDKLGEISLRQRAKERLHELMNLNLEERLSVWRAVESEIVEEMSNGFKLAKDELVKEFERNLDELLVSVCRRVGVVGVEGILNHALSRLQGFRDEIAKGNEALELFLPEKIALLLEELETELTSLSEEVGRLSSWKRFLQRRRLEEISRQIVTRLVEKTELCWLQLRRETFEAIVGEFEQMLNERLRRVVELEESLKSVCDRLKAAGNLLFNHDFSFQVPIGVCTIRPTAAKAQGDNLQSVEGFIRKFVPEVAEEAAVREFLEQWRLPLEIPDDLVDCLLGLARKHLQEPFAQDVLSLSELDKNLPTLQHLVGHLTRISSEIAAVNEVITRGEKFKIRFVIAPATCHAILQKTLQDLIPEGITQILSGDEDSLIFVQIRVGIPLRAFKQNCPDFTAYVRQSEMDGNIELRHTRPVWRLLPEIIPEAPDHTDCIIALGKLVGAVRREDGSLFFGSERFGSERELLEFLHFHPEQVVEILRRADRFLSQHGRKNFEDANLPEGVKRILRQYRGGK